VTAINGGNRKFSNNNKFDKIQFFHGKFLELLAKFPKIRKILHEKYFPKQSLI